MSYYESMEQVDNSLAQRIVTQADNHRVPVSSDVTSSNKFKTLWTIMMIELEMTLF